MERATEKHKWVRAVKSKLRALRHFKVSPVLKIDVRMQSKRKTNKMWTIADETHTDYSFLSMYHYTKSKNYLKRRMTISNSSLNSHVYWDTLYNIIFIYECIELNSVITICNIWMFDFKFDWIIYDLIGVMQICKSVYTPIHFLWTLLLLASYQYIILIHWYFNTLICKYCNYTWCHYLTGLWLKGL